LSQHQFIAEFILSKEKLLFVLI